MGAVSVVGGDTAEVSILVECCVDQELMYPKASTALTSQVQAPSAMAAGV